MLLEIMVEPGPSCPQLRTGGLCILFGRKCWDCAPHLMDVCSYQSRDNTGGVIASLTKQLTAARSEANSATATKYALERELTQANKTIAHRERVFRELKELMVKL